MERNSPTDIPWRELGIAWRDAFLLVAVAVAAAFAFNAIRENGIPVIRHAPFDLLGPCPEVQGDISRLAVEKLRPDDPHVRVVDARMPWDYAAGHVPGAWPMPMYETAPLDREIIARLASMKAGTWVVVVDETGGQLAERALSALAAAGVRGLFVLEGGMAAWKRAGKLLETMEIPIVSELPDNRRGIQVVDALPENVLPSSSESVQLPFDDLLPPEEDVLKRLRARLQAPIYVVSDRELPPDPARARPVHPGWGVAAQLRTLGFSRVFVVRKPLLPPSPEGGESREDAHE